MRAVFGGVSRSLCSISLVAVLLSNLGCGGAGTDDKFKGARGSVSGKITFKGAPVPAGSTVVFQSKEGGYTASGTTNAAGEYRLLYDGKSSMPAVTYIVGVTPPPVQTKADPAKMLEASKAGSDQQPAEAEVPAGPFPSKYYIGSTSGLEFPVKDGANKADFDLAE